jgi:hypothetical protein
MAFHSFIQSENGRSDCELHIKRTANGFTRRITVSHGIITVKQSRRRDDFRTEGGQPSSPVGFRMLRDRQNFCFPKVSIDDDCLSADRLWFPSSIETIELLFPSPTVTSVVFEFKSKLGEIGNSAFPGTGLKSVVIPSFVTILGDRSFGNCESIVSVLFESGSRLIRICSSSFTQSGLGELEIPASVLFLESHCFAFCVLLSSVEFESGSRLLRIEKSVFSCTALSSLVLPSSVEFIDGSAFEGSPLECVEFFPNENHFKIYGSFISDITEKICVRHIGNSSSVMIPSHFEILGECCFSHSDKLKWVTFERESMLREIGKRTFIRSGIMRLVIPASVEMIGDGSFLNCSSLTSVELEVGSRLRQIGEVAFYSTGLIRIDIPSSVEIVGPRCFGHCLLLVTVVFETESQLRFVAANAFSGSPCADSVSLPPLRHDV